MLKTVSAIAAAAALAAAAMLLPSVTPQAVAVAPIPAAKSDLADIPAACERQGWPYYDANCLRDESRNAGRVPQVRMITPDRVQTSRQDVSEPEPRPQLQIAAADVPAHPLAVPAWPEYITDLQVLTVR